MEHYYVISGNEFGINRSSKKNFAKDKLSEATSYFFEIHENDFYAAVIYVSEDGKEEIIIQKLND